MVILNTPLCATVNNLLTRYSLLLLWISFNGFLFWNTYRMYKGQPEYYYLRSILGRGLCTSRGTGMVINVNCCLVLIPVCKLTATLIRKYAVQISPSFVRFVFNRSKLLHITCAFTIVIASLIHTGSHVVNAVNFSRHYNPLWTEINMANYAGQNPIEMVVTSLPGITGLVMVLLLSAMVCTSMARFRYRHYNVFYYVHLLFCPFLVLLMIHPLRAISTDDSGILKEQSNFQEHVPGCLWNVTHSSIQWTNQTLCQQEPQFKSMETRTWIWLSIPLAIYGIELLTRRLVGRKPVPVKKVYFHHDVMELTMDLWLENCAPGQYVLVQCPEISTFEWHPFSISSCCDLTHYHWTIHLKTNGDWCRRLKILLLSRSTSCNSKTGGLDVTFYVDGPFASPLVDVLRSNIAICVAGGIGLTPFMAVLHYLIRHSWQKRPERLHVIWMVQNVASILWAAPTFIQLIEDVWSSTEPEKLELRLQITRTSASDPYMHSVREQYPALYHRIQFGRPNWTDLFTVWKDVYRRRRIHVFSCGPKEMNRQIRQLCATFSSSGTSFICTHEHFS